MTSPDALAAILFWIGALLAAAFAGGWLAERTVLGAAVVDDVLGLLLLSFLVAGARGTGGTLLLGLGAVVFLAAAVTALHWLLRRLPVSPRPVPGIVLCLALGWGAHRVGLAPIVGAFAAGL